MKRKIDFKVVPSQKDEYNTLSILERQYVRNHFNEYIKSNSHYLVNGISHSNYIADIMSQVMIFTDGLFTLPQLFFLSTTNDNYSADWSAEGLDVLRQESINYINDVATDAHDLGDIKTFIQKIMSLNPIVFNSLIYLIHDSKLFYDSEDGEKFIPDLGEYQKQLKKWLEKIH